MLAPLRLVTPRWDTQLVRDILALERLRYAPQDVPDSHPQPLIAYADMLLEGGRGVEEAAIMKSSI